MKKRIISLLACLCLIAGCVLPVWAKEEAAPEETETILTIKNQKDFLAFAENCRLDSYSTDLRVCLETDLDLSGTEFEAIPIFCGTFEGGGHTITGLTLSGEGSVQGLFRYLTETALVQDLSIQGNVHPGGSRSTVGGLAGSNAGRIVNCSFTGVVSGGEWIGGLAGINTVSGIIENCKVGGVISGNHFTGGVAGENLGVIRGCQNLAVVNKSSQQNQVELADITIDSLLNAEAANTVTDIGGIAGASSGVIRDCINRGDVGYRHMGYNVGGIAGSQSGYITDCENYGNILGRKEVGGIVGQLEPAARIEYEADAVQILEQQLAAMSSTVNHAASNAQIGAQEMEGQIYDLQDSVDSAMDALEILTPDRNDPQLPDSDSLQAAQNGLSDSLADMSTTLWGIGETTDSVMGNLTNDLYRLQGQMNEMRATLNNISDKVGGSLKDVSDEDTEEDRTGKVELCTNHGSVLADLNAGGIVGAMALENDLDPEDDWQITGNNSLNFESELRAVLRNCENRATVTARKQNAGGIAGWLSLGLVHSCRNSGALDAAGAENVGGISGLSTGFIRESAARCRISGASSVGGIAGSATVVTDCSSMVLLEEPTEKYGAVLGIREEPQQDVETPISGNYYIAAGSDPGGIDGISYQGLAQAAQLTEFLGRENLPEMFRSVTITFRDGVGNEKRFNLTPGQGLAKKDIPALPQQAGQDGVWEGLAEADLTEIYFDMTFQAVYTEEAVVIQSKGLNQSGKPLVLLEGSFPKDTEIQLSKPNISVALLGGQSLLDHWCCSLSGEGTVTGMRLCLPEDADKDHLKLLVQDDRGLWSETEFAVEGSYAVVKTDARELTVAIIQERGVHVLVVAGIGLAAVAAIALWLFKKRKQA